MANAKIVNNVVVEILKPIEGFALEDCFHPLILKDTVYVPDDVQVNWILQEDGTFAAPVVEVVEEIASDETAE
jgi:hypothetical protein